MNRSIASSLVMIALLAAVVAGGTIAIFTDQAVQNSTPITAGTVDIAAGDSSSWSADAGNMAPGDTVTKTVYVRNNGTLELKYGLDGAIEGALFTCQPASPDCDGGPAGLSLARNGTPLFQWTAGTHTSGAAKAYVLAPGASDTWDLQVALPLAAGDSYQADAGNFTLTFDAEQTANNP